MVWLLPSIQHHRPAGPNFPRPARRIVTMEVGAWLPWGWAHGYHGGGRIVTMGLGA